MAREERLTLRLKGVDLEWLEAKADENESSISAVVRKLIIAARRRETLKNGDPTHGRPEVRSTR